MTGRIHPVQSVLLAGSLPLFLGTLLSDWAYWTTLEVQWINFAAWLIAGALVLAGPALLWAIVDSLRVGVRRNRLRGLYTLALLATFVVGVFDALVHGKDGWAAMPDGLTLSVLVSVLALLSVVLSFSTHRRDTAR